MNKKITAEFAILVIILVAVIFGFLIWQSNQIKNEQQIQENAGLSDIKEKSISQKKEKEIINENVDDSNNSINTDETEKRRISGTGCYAKDDEGNDNEYELSKSFNLDPENDIIKYSNQKYGISFNIPYNKKWGNSTCKSLPYQESNFVGIFSVEFGKPRAFEAGPFFMNVGINRSVQDVISEQDNDAYPKRINISNLDIVTYYSWGESSSKIYEIIGNKYNYSFSYASAGLVVGEKGKVTGKENTDNIIKLEEIIKSVKIFEPAVNLCSDSPETTEIGNEIYPIDSKYYNLRFLGQIFTASDCSEDRLMEVNYNSKEYDLGVSLTLKNNPSVELVNIMKEIGFSCAEAEKKKSSECREWHLEKNVNVNDLLKLKPYYKEFYSDDCINCG